MGNLRKILVGFFEKHLRAHPNLSQNMLFKTQIFRKTWLSKPKSFAKRIYSKPKSFEHYGWNRKKTRLEMALNLLVTSHMFLLSFFGADYFC